MVNIFGRIVVVEFTNVTEIPCKGNATSFIDTCLADRLHIYIWDKWLCISIYLYIYVYRYRKYQCIICILCMKPHTTYLYGMTLHTRDLFRGIAIKLMARFMLIYRDYAHLWFIRCVDIVHFYVSIFLAMHIYIYIYVPWQKRHV